MISLAEINKHLPYPLKTILLWLYEKITLNPVIDKKLLRDTMEYYGLSEYEIISIAKLENELNILLWNALNPKTPQEIARFYKSTPFYPFGLLYWHAQRKQREFRAKVAQVASGDVLDYGGGMGDLSTELAQKGLNVTYGDVRGETFKFAEWLFKKRGLKVEVVDLEQQNLCKEYDTIICIDVIEHIPNPQAVLQRIAKHLKTNGKLIITHLRRSEEDDLSNTLHLKPPRDFEQLLGSLGLVKTNEEWLWVKSADKRVDLSNTRVYS